MLIIEIRANRIKLGAMDGSDNDDRDLQQNMQTNTEEGRRRRRTRSDDKDRNYKCSCGRSYLSYPALYTHIKTKHDGKAPGIIQMPRTQKGTKLKKYNFREQDEQEFQDTDKPIQQLLVFLSGFGGSSQEYSVAQLFQNIRQEDRLPLVEAIADCDERKHNYALTDSGIYNISIDHVFARFLLKLCANRIDLKIIQQIVVLILIWRSHLNSTYSKFDKDSYDCYCRDSNANNILEVVNELIMSQFNEKSSNFQKPLENGKLFSSPQRRMYHLTKFIYVFAKWLFAEKYTNSKLQLNTFGSENIPPI